MTVEFVAITAVVGVAGFGLAFATFWLTFGSRIATAETQANQAILAAKDAEIAAKEADDKVGVLAASFALYREQIAREYIHREAMREVEDRLTQAIERLGERLDRFLDRNERQIHHP